MRCTKPVFLGKANLIVPCGKCIACRLTRANEWAVRIIHEMDSHEENVFLTLTYDDDHLPADYSISKIELVNFIKRLRKQLEPRKIRYYGCGEYGDDRGRPHYHLILFNVGFGDFERFYIGKKPFYRTPCWTKGNVYLGTVTIRSAAYVAKYIMKNVGNDDFYIRPKPFRLLSQGLGRNFAKKHYTQISHNMCINFDGHKRALPRYYIKHLNIDTFGRRYLGNETLKKLLDEYSKKYKIIDLNKLYRIVQDRAIGREKLIIAREKILKGA